MRTAVYVLGGVLAVPVGLFLGAWLLALAARKYGQDEEIGALIGTPAVRFAGHDDTLRVQSEQRRASAEAFRRDAARIDTRDRDQPPSRIHLIGGGR